MRFVLATLIFIFIPNVLSTRLALQKLITTEAKLFGGLDLSADYTHITPPEIIKQENYTSETHTVTTEDGYILTVYRIPGPPNSIPVYLQHGLLQCSADWLHAGRGKSLVMVALVTANENNLGLKLYFLLYMPLSAFILSDHGYDVWLGNARGNTYSKGHQNLSTADPKYWNFSWEEMGRYDLPAVITYITNLKQESLFYIEHSMGATTFSVMAIERPDVAQKVKAMIALAPATYAYHLKNFLPLLAPFWKEVQIILNSLDIYEFLPRNKLFDLFANNIKNSKLLEHISRILVFIIGGFNRAKFNSSLLPRIWSNFPAGTSVKLFIHSLQQINVNKFRKFDYGSRTNLLMYNSRSPPLFDLSKVDVPVAVFSSTGDWLVGVQDTEKFYEEVPRKLGYFKVKDPKYTHFDFLWAVDAPLLIYSQVLDIMKNYNNSI